MRISLIAPPFRGTVRGLPLGLAYLAAVLERNGFDVCALDMTVDGVGEKTLVALLERFEPDVVGISTAGATYLEAIWAAEICKATLGRSLMVVLGGPHVTFGAKAVLARHNCVDICVIGEAEETMVDLCRALDRRDSSVRSVEGIVFREGSFLRRTSPRRLIDNLDCLPLPARNHFRMEHYPDAVGIFEKGASNKVEIIASRGCPFRCGFCSTQAFWQHKYRRRSPADVMREMEYLFSKGYTDFYFDDDIFTVQRDWVTKLCRMIIDLRLPIRWACGTRVDTIDLEMLGIMKKAGCEYIYFGVESGSDAINEVQKKGTSIAEVEAVYELLRDIRIFASVSLIFGLPGETWETARNTVDWVRDVLRPDEVWISKATCYPGTQLAARYGVLPEDYEFRRNGVSSSGLPYGTGGIYTPFFRNNVLVRRIWDYIKNELSLVKVDFGDDKGEALVVSD